MKVVLLSDIHANLEALDAVIRAVEKEKPDRIVCLGDVVGYGPDPDACVERIAGFADVTLCGNHDEAARGDGEVADFNPEARDAILWTRRVIRPQTVERLQEYALIAVEEGWMGVHATPEAPGKWEYLMTGADIRRNLEILPTPVCFVGHSHYPGVYARTEDGDILEHRTVEVRLTEKNRYLINVGSVGQPRDGDPRAAYGIFDTEKRVYTLKRVAYPIPPVQRKMVAAGLPAKLIERLAMGF
jgi:diadenosine tetraphosphatase ApaH/serine/threonine PP2A family protein phosphatase